MEYSIAFNLYCPATVEFYDDIIEVDATMTVDEIYKMIHDKGRLIFNNHPFFIRETSLIRSIMQADQGL